MSTDFYNKVAKKFGGYQSKAKYTSEYPAGDPEADFLEKILAATGSSKSALDVGCADGRFTLSLADKFKHITAVDLSQEMLASAKKNQAKLDVANVSFELQDAFTIKHKDASFDLVYNRRGPSNFKETWRLLKQAGVFVFIRIGERDCKAIKEVFGRGQGFGEWNESKLEQDKKELEALGFEITYAKDYFYNEYYPRYDDFDLFLQGVPIFEDFDSDKDRQLLERYVADHASDKGILLERHRVVLVVRK